MFCACSSINGRINLPHIKTDREFELTDYYFVITAANSLFSPL
jgi:hypothetical protein